MIQWLLARGTRPSYDELVSRVNALALQVYDVQQDLARLKTCPPPVVPARRWYQPLTDRLNVRSQPIPREPNTGRLQP
jgi:hypothetical protein